MNALERPKMAPRILQVPKKEIPPAWLGAKEQNKAPDVVFRISIEEVKKPPYDVPKKYPDRLKSILQKAKDELKEKEAKGYNREDAIKDFFEIQDEISQHIKNQEK